MHQNGHPKPIPVVQEETWLDPQLTPKFVCPFLGQSLDSDSYHNYPSAGNFCHRPGKPQRVDLDHQEAVCLNLAYCNCPVFQEDWKGKFPREISGDGPSRLSEALSIVSPLLKMLWK